MYKNIENACIYWDVYQAENYKFCREVAKAVAEVYGVDVIVKKDGDVFYINIDDSTRNKMFEHCRELNLEGYEEESSRVLTYLEYESKMNEALYGNYWDGELHPDNEQAEFWRMLMNRYAKPNP